MRQAIIAAAITATAVLGTVAAQPARADQVSPIVTRANNGQTITVQVGEVVSVTLTNTYWDPSTVLPPLVRVKTTSDWTNFASSDPAVITPQGPPTYTSDPADTDGKYFDSATVVYSATRPGVATVTAVSTSRYLCGAKLNCPFTVVLNRFAVTFDVQPTTVTAPARLPSPLVR
jgi:FtsP/CotA-like multicopper oxidase with cupredoxin domain